MLPTGGLGVGALVTGGLGWFVPFPAPPPPPPPPSPTVSGGGGPGAPATSDEAAEADFDGLFAGVNGVDATIVDLKRSATPDEEDFGENPTPSLGAMFYAQREREHFEQEYARLQEQLRQATEGAAKEKPKKKRKKSKNAKLVRYVLAGAAGVAAVRGAKKVKKALDGMHETGIDRTLGEVVAGGSMLLDAVKVAGKMLSEAEDDGDDEKLVKPPRRRR